MYMANNFFFLNVDKNLIFFEPFMIFAKKSQILIIEKVKMLFLIFFFCQITKKKKGKNLTIWTCFTQKLHPLLFSIRYRSLAPISIGYRSCRSLSLRYRRFTNHIFYTLTLEKCHKLKFVFFLF